MKSGTEENKDQNNEGRSSESNDGVKFPAEVEVILNKLQPEEKATVIQQLRVTYSRTSSFSGPIPPPELLGEYNQVVPNGAERIMQMAENQSAHRIQLEDHAIKEQLNQSRHGQWLGFILVFILIGVALTLALTGHDGVAATIASTTIVSVATVFVIGKKQQQKNLEEKK